MTRAYAILSALALVALIGGTALWTSLSAGDECGATGVAGASIGGPFELVNAAGRTVTDKDVIDRPALVYFGYTFCPDVCPLDMSRNALAVDLLEDAGVDAKPVFISIDPNRDTVEVLARYAADMHPKMEALTGSDDQIRTAAQAYKVYYAKGEGDGDYYLMDHSAFTYLMLPEKGLGAYFRREATAEEIAETAACLIGS